MQLKVDLENGLAIDLRNTGVDNFREDNGVKPLRRMYFGCGEGHLALDNNGNPSVIIYDDESHGPETLETILDAYPTIWRGMFSCWEFIPREKVTKETP